jgi:hypothetical protein
MTVSISPQSSSAPACQRAGDTWRGGPLCDREARPVFSALGAVAQLALFLPAVAACPRLLHPAQRTEGAVRLAGFQAHGVRPAVGAFLARCACWCGKATAQFLHPPLQGVYTVRRGFDPLPRVPAVQQFQHVFEAWNWNRHRNPPSLSTIPSVVWFGSPPMWSKSPSNTSQTGLFGWLFAEMTLNCVCRYRRITRCILRRFWLADDCPRRNGRSTLGQSGAITQISSLPSQGLGLRGWGRYGLMLQAVGHPFAQTPARFQDVCFVSHFGPGHGVPHRVDGGRMMADAWERLHKSWGNSHAG